MPSSTRGSGTDEPTTSTLRLSRRARRRDPSSVRTDREARGRRVILLGRALRITLFFVLLALFAPLDLAVRVRPVQRRTGSASRSWQRPSRGPSDGDDGPVDDVMSRVIWGARTELRSCSSHSSSRSSIGVPLGLVSGYFGGRLDRILVLLMDAMFAFPSLLLAIVIAFLLTGSIGQRHPHRGDRDHRRLHPAVLPRGPQPRDQHPRGVVRRGGTRLGARPFTVIRKYVFFNVDPERPAARDAERGRRDPAPSRRSASSATGSSRPRPPSGVTTSSARSPTRPRASGGRRFAGPRDRAPRDRPDAGRRGSERDDQPGPAQQRPES